MVSIVPALFLNKRAVVLINYRQGQQVYSVAVDLWLSNGLKSKQSYWGDEGSGTNWSALDQ